MNEHRFYREHYEEAIFRSKLPTVVVHPFEFLLHSPYRELTIPMGLFVEDEDIINKNVNNVLELLTNATGMNNLHQCSVILLVALKYKYFNLKYEWWKQSEHIRDIIGSSQSNMMWECYKYDGMKALGTTRLNDIQKLWVYLSSVNEKSKEKEHEFSMFEYLSGFVNPDLYSAINKKDEYVRENADYEEMHEALLKGDLDTIEQL